MNEFDEYLKSLGAVKPLKNTNDEIILQRKSNSNALNANARRENAQSVWTENSGFLSMGEVQFISPDDPIGFKKDGVQNGVYKSLRLGKYDIHAVLNLKGQSLDASRKALLKFIQQSLQKDHRSLLLQHGNGHHSNPPKATLKSYLNNWLPQFSEVLAFHSALPSHGGNGATYVLIKKSEEARLDNKERYQKRKHHQ